VFSTASLLWQGESPLESSHRGRASCNLTAHPKVHDTVQTQPLWKCLSEADSRWGKAQGATLSAIPVL
jgi:hypothetical protein